MAKNEKRRVMISLDDDLLARLEKAASTAHVSKSAYISALLSKDLQETDVYLEEFQRMLAEAVENMKA